jgi:SNF2 family DNA or RNA helicase
MLNQLVTDGKINQKSMHNYLHALRSTVNGGHGQKTGELELDANGDHVHVVHWHTSKAEAVVAKLASLHAADGEAKILVFSEHNQLLSAIEDRLGDVGLESRSVIGSTSHKKRGDAIEAFMTDPPTKVFLLGAKPGAVGITLTAASVVVICEPMLNPALELQAIGRSQRLGQTKPVTVVRFCLADTVEERVRAVVARKASGGAGRSSTAAAANPGMAEVKCSVGDMNEMLRCEEPESEEEEDMEGEGEEVEDNY